MKLNEISEYEEYQNCEEEIREWVESRYKGLSIDFLPQLEIVQTDKRKYSPKRVKKIVEVVNIKIGDILEKNADRIYTASLVERVLKNHPEFDIEFKDVEELKTNRQFLDYVKELRI